MIRFVFQKGHFGRDVEQCRAGQGDQLGNWYNEIGGQ